MLLEGWPRFVVSSFVVRQLLANSKTNGTNIDHKWDQSGPEGGGQGVLENQRKYNKQTSKEAK